MVAGSYPAGDVMSMSPPQAAGDDYDVWPTKRLSRAVEGQALRNRGNRPRHGANA